MRALVAHNKPEEKNTVLKKRGGTIGLMHNQFTGFIQDKGVDHTGLGRWRWLLV